MSDVQTKPRHRSKTYWAAMAVSALGVVEINMPMLKTLLGDWYGLAFIGVGVLMAILRELTSSPVA